MIYHKFVEINSLLRLFKVKLHETFRIVSKSLRLLRVKGVIFAKNCCQERGDRSRKKVRHIYSDY